MILREAPWYRDFTFVYKGVTIYVPLTLNEKARSKRNTFWDWLLFKHTFETHIDLTIEHIIEEENV